MSHCLASWFNTHVHRPFRDGLLYLKLSADSYALPCCAFSLMTSPHGHQLYSLLVTEVVFAASIVQLLLYSNFTGSSHSVTLLIWKLHLVSVDLRNSNII